MQRCGWRASITAAGDDATGGGDTGSDATTDDKSEEEPKKMVFLPRLTGRFISLGHWPGCILNFPLALPFPDGDFYADPEQLPFIDRQNPPEVTLIFRQPKKGEIDYSIKAMKLPPLPEAVEPGEGDLDKSRDDANGDANEKKGEGEREKQ